MAIVARAAAVLTGSALLLGGVAVVPAAAACGGYGEAACPTVTIPAGQTNPDRREVPAPGVVVVPQSVADRTAPTDETSSTTRRAATRNATDIEVGTVVQASVALPGASRTWRVRIETPSGDGADFGTLRSDRQGDLATPAIRYTRAGTYTWVFTSGSVSRFLVLRAS